MKTKHLQLFIPEIILISNVFAQNNLQGAKYIEARALNLNYNLTAGNLNTMYKECIGAGRPGCFTKRY